MLDRFNYIFIEKDGLNESVNFFLLFTSAIFTLVKLLNCKQKLSQT